MPHDFAEHVDRELPKQHYIDGEWRSSESRETFPVWNPATGSKITDVAKAGETEVERAVDAARGAFQSGEWGEIDNARRGEYLRSLAEEIRERHEELARLESLDVGRPITEARGVVDSAISHIEYYAGLTDKIQGDSIPVPGNRTDYTRLEPYGVSVHIIPWNAPFSLAFRDIAPALACGNTVIAKPPLEAPLSNVAIGELATAAGIPDGVINVIPGPGDPVGSGLVSHPGTDRTTFTGSVATGREVMRNSAETVSSFNLELGGKSPNIVFSDADIDAALDGAIRGIFRNAGQMCVAGSRLFVHESIYDQFFEQLVERTEQLVLGEGLDENTDVGPVITPEAKEQILEYIELGESEGARLVTGGGEPSGPLEDGNFVEPTIFADVKNDMRIAQEEIFGPVLCVLQFSDESEVIEMANDTDYGLYAGVWTNNLDRAHRMAAELEAGYISINEYPVLFPGTPFGGYKQSGFGRERGLQAIDQYTQIKNVLMNHSPNSH